LFILINTLKDNEEEQIMDCQIFNGLASLKTLVIENSACLMRIERDTFSLLPNLESLDLYNCEIELIESGAFEHLPKLRILEIVQNKLKKCPSLNELSNLERLELSNNEIELIDGLFENMEDRPINTKLRVLTLNSNWLSSLPANAFSSLTSLVTLDLSSNRLKAISKDAFNGLLNLRGLIYSDNVIDLRIFNPELENLEVVDLNRSSFRIIDEESKSWSFRNQIIVSVDLELRDHPFLQKLAQAGRIYLSKYCEEIE
jgi:Leucine-rich repeat (LRR) protein